MRAGITIWLLIGVVAAILTVGSEPLRAETGTTTWLAAAEAEAAPPPRDLGPERLSPLKVTLEYALVSDYVWRGYNMTEYAGEGRERPSHQVTVDVKADLARLTGRELGGIGVQVWASWYSGYLAQTAGASGDHLQEVDYKAYWFAHVPDLSTDVEIGWVCYTYPRLKGTLPGTRSDYETTAEVYFKIQLDDSELLGRESPLLSPFIYYGLDVDLADKGSWIEIGVEHELNLGDLDMFNETTPLRYVALRPSLVLGIDHRYLQGLARVRATPIQKADRLGNLTYGLDILWDLSGALGVKSEYGDLTLAGFIKFSDAFRDDLLSDELYGGCRVIYEW